jgi:hypothetical protein
MVLVCPSDSTWEDAKVPEQDEEEARREAAVIRYRAANT